MALLKIQYTKIATAVILFVLLTVQSAQAGYLWYNSTTTDDSYIMSGAPDGNQGASSGVQVGNENVFGDERGLLKFNITPVYGLQIQQATLIIVVDSGNIGTADIKTISQTWSEDTVTWNNQPTTSGVANTATISTGTVSIDVTNSVQQMVNSSTHYGWMIEDQSLSANVYSAIKSNQFPSGKPSLNISYVPANSTVGIWIMNEGSGTWANDTSGFNNNGTLKGTFLPTWATNLNNGSVNGTALRFDGVSSNISVPTSGSLNFTSNFSISAWIKPINLSTQPAIASKWIGVDNRRSWVFYISTTGKLQYSDSADGVLTAATITTDNVITTNRWQFVTLVKNGTGATFYVNGAAVSDDGVPINSNLFLSSAPFDIGDSINAAGAVTTQFNGTIDELRAYNYALTSSEITALYQQFQPVPAYPVGGITLTGTYPPLTTSVNFSWHDSEYPADRLTVAEDSAFNLVVHDTYYSTDYANIALESGKTYYWKVTQYNSTTGLSGDTSATQTFTLTATAASSDGTAGINGVVYETVSGVKTPLSDVQVFIYNNTWSKTIFTGSNGYYVFSGLADYSVYYITAKKENYVDSAIQTVNTTSAAWVTHDIPLIKCISVYCGYFNTQYVKLTLVNPFDTPYTGVVVNGYKGDEASASHTATTGNDGSVTFLLIKDQEYTFTFGSPLNKEETIITKEDSYTFIYWGSPDTNRDDNISWSLSTVDNNATTTYLNLTYSSNTTTTTLNFWVKNSTGATLYSTSTSGVTSWDVGYPANDSAGLVYIWGFNATHPTFGTFGHDKVITFDGRLIDLGFSDERYYDWISVGLIVFVALIFSRGTNRYGFVLIPLWSIFLDYVFDLDWSWALLMTALVIGVLAYLRTAEKKSGGYPY